MQFKQPYKIHIDVQCTTEISVHAAFSHCRQNYGLQAVYSSMALKVG